MRRRKFPSEPIVRIIKLDTDVMSISSGEITAVVAQACESFLLDLTTNAWKLRKRDRIGNFIAEAIYLALGDGARVLSPPRDLSPIRPPFFLCSHHTTPTK